MIEINYLSILIAGVLSMVLGMFWYGFLFKKQWMEVIGVSGMTEEMQKKMQKESMHLYLIQFLLVLFQAYILSIYINGFPVISGFSNAIRIYLGFIIPTLAGSAMWTNDTKRVSWMRFSIQAGYQLVLFIVFGFVL